VRFYHEQSPAPPLDGIEPPLRGLRVVDLTRVLAGPTATMLLADLGADVIKVEEITRGDDTSSVFPRSTPPRTHAMSLRILEPSRQPHYLTALLRKASHLPPESAYFLSVNRNKRSITVDFKSPAGLEILASVDQTIRYFRRELYFWKTRYDWPRVG
jgi:succinate--hydroxymethylglutarate CoA-transferase